MRTKIITSIVAGVVALTLLSGKVANMLLSFVLVGVIPGTHFTIPYWLMMAGYCTIISLIVANYLEIGLMYLYRRKTASLSKAKMPHRRYSTLQG